jgi:hypothetical protein
VTAYTRLRMQAIGDEGTERSAVLAHELRNCLSAVTVGFELVKKGTVAAGGSVSAVVSRNLAREWARSFACETCLAVAASSRSTCPG